jgi:hypothetical protein
VGDALESWAAQASQWFRGCSTNDAPPPSPDTESASAAEVAPHIRGNNAAKMGVGGNQDTEEAWVKVAGNAKSCAEAAELQLCEVYGVGCQTMKFRAGRTAISVADSMRSANRMFGGWIERDGTRLPQSDKVEAGVRYVYVGGERLGTYFTVVFCSFLCLRLPCI